MGPRSCHLSSALVKPMAMCTPLSSCHSFDWLFLKKIIFILFFPLSFSPLVPPTPRNHQTVVHVHYSFFFFLILPLRYPCHQLSSCFPCMNLSLFSLLAQFVHQIPHMSEIIWYLSFSDWLISLNITFSRSIHVVAKDKIFFSFVTEQNSFV